MLRFSEAVRGMTARQIPDPSKGETHACICDRLEGHGTMPSAIVVIEFPSMAAAKAWYSDPAYAPLIKLRQSGSDLDFILVEGV